MWTITFRINKQWDLTVQHGNYVQSLVIEHDGRKYEKENVYVYMTGSICYTAETDTTL